MSTTERARGAARASEPLLARLVEEGVFPGAALAIATSAGLPEIATIGTLDYSADSPTVTAKTLYDLASLTKVVATTALTVTLLEDRSLELDTRVAEVLTDWEGAAKEQVTVGHLLSHTSGLPSHARFYLELSGADAIRAAVRSTPLVAVPGTTCVYSDLGIILLGELLEVVADAPFGLLVRERVLRRLELADTTYAPTADELDRIAPTEDNAWRGGVVRGAVHDNNAYAMGGVAPHAGLFATAGDVARLGAALLPGATSRLASAGVLSRWFASADRLPGPWAYGVRILGRDPLFGAAPSAGTFGATGFTGTLLAVDPERAVAVALLSNGIHPTRENLGVTAARGLLLDRVLLAWDSADG